MTTFFLFTLGMKKVHFCPSFFNVESSHKIENLQKKYIATIDIVANIAVINGVDVQPSYTLIYSLKL